MNIKVLKHTMSLTSSIALEDLKLVQAMRPDALKIKDEDGNDVFVVAIKKTGDGGVNKCSVDFAPEADAGGHATLAVTLPDDDTVKTDVKTYISDHFGAALNHLKTIEARLPAVVADVRAEREILANAIDVID